MNQGFPSYNKAAQKGDHGVDIVSRVINEGFGWLFKRNHQEHDFGIDAHVDIVLENGSVTGQMLALQIKYGTSFFQEKNQWGYIFRGEQKHFNYLANYPTPVLILICNPETNDIYWINFSPDATSRAGNNWKIAIPFENKLAETKSRIAKLLPPPADYLSDMQSYWEINNVIVNSVYLYFIIDRKDVETLGVSSIRGFFNRIRSTKELAAHCQGKVEIGFHGYNEDPRELFQIPEMRKYIPILANSLPELFFFAYTGERAHTLKTFAFCLTEVEVKSKPQNKKDKIRVEFTTDKIGQFLESHFPGLNEMTEWLNLPIEVNKRISFDVFRALGFEPPLDED